MSRKQQGEKYEKIECYFFTEFIFGRNKMSQSLAHSTSFIYFFSLNLFYTSVFFFR